MEKYNVPTAPFVVLEDYEAAVAYVKAHPQQYPMVIKADGLAAGKGVKIATDEADALETLNEYMVQGTLGDAGKKIVIEEFMPGEEMSVFYLTDGKKFIRLIAAKDYKKSDELRMALREAGYAVKDTPQGQQVEKI
jgi:phosphoribosylamine--glycine ligase